jgi:hypothetical protein
MAKDLELPKVNDFTYKITYDADTDTCITSSTRKLSPFDVLLLSVNLVSSIRKEDQPEMLKLIQHILDSKDDDSIKENGYIN